MQHRLGMALAALMLAAQAHAATFIVTSASDSGAGSLRQALADAAAAAGEDTINMAGALSGQTITLTSGALVVNDAAGVTVDASALAGGLTVHGNYGGRIFENYNGTLTLRGLTLTGGLVTSGFGGGAVLNDGTLIVDRCAFTGNQAGYGAALFVQPSRVTMVRQCTFAGNSAIHQGGAILNRGTTTVYHSTVAANSAGIGGGIRNDFLQGSYNGTLSLINSIVAGNTATASSDFDNAGSLSKSGANIVQAAIGYATVVGDITGSGTIDHVNPLLAALDSYGGPTKTMPPQVSSPAVDAAFATTLSFDQRGVPRPLDGNADGFAIADIGAVEAAYAKLTSLGLSAGSLAPAFAHGTLNYTASVPNATASITVTPTLADSGDAITVNGSAVTSGSHSAAIALNIGANTITIVVAAQDGVTTRTYTVVVTRPSNNASLSSLALSAGTLSPVFTSGTASYSASVPNGTSSITITPVAAGPNAAITVNGATVASGAASGSIALSEGANAITTVVTAQDGATTSACTVTVVRARLVTTVDDDGPGSLRQAIFDSEEYPGADLINFSSALNGQIIALTSGHLNVSFSDEDLIIDASTLASGLTIQGGSGVRVFANFGTLTLRGLTLTGAIASFPNPGGAIWNLRTLVLERCLISGNIARDGGGISNSGSMVLRHCTFSGNQAVLAGGAIHNNGTAALIHCTIAGNTAGSVGGVYNLASGSLTLENSIVADNSGGSGADMQNAGALTRSGASIVETTIVNTGSISGAGSISNADPLLGPLGNHGGPTRTMEPQSGSPAIDAAAGSTETLDQRGALRPRDGDGDSVAVSDIGALEVSDVSLASLVLSAGDLSPVFASGTTSYTASVPSSTTSLAVTPTAASGSGSITVNGATVASGSASGSISLSVGANVITVIGTAQDGIATKTYSVTVTRAPQNNANLASLAVSAGELSPAFSSGTTFYTASVPNTTSSLTVTPTAADSEAAIKVNSVTVASGSASGSIALSVGGNPISVTVTAPDGVTTKTYVITVARAASSNAELASITFSLGELSPAFASATTSYLVVANAAAISVTPTATHANAVITVNSVAVASGSASGSIGLNLGGNSIEVVVTAENGFTTKTYSFHAVRPRIVTTTADSGAGSLRQAVLDAAATINTDLIWFDSALSGQTIALASGVILLNEASGVTIDASGLAGGVTIDGGGIDRIFWIASHALLRGLTLTRGFASSGNGGAAVVNFGTVTLERCTLTGSTGGFGGAIWNNGGATLALRHCTVSGNVATTQSGAIENRGTAFIRHCTIAGNSAPNFGGIRNEAGVSLTLENSIVAGNTGASGADIHNLGALTRTGANIVQAAIMGGGSIAGSGSISSADPMLKALAKYGGPTRTMLPLPGSPAIDAAIGSTESIDQRGFSRPVDGDNSGAAAADIGAVEVDNSTVNLSSLAISSGALSPAFASATTSYTALVSASSVTVIPTAEASSVTITVNGATVISGAASASIALNPGANTITIIVTVPNSSTKTYTITVTRQVPEIVVSGNGSSIPNGDSSPASADHTDFGGVAAATGSVTRVFTISNSGDFALTVGSVLVAGSNASDFTVTTQPPSSIAAGGAATFQVTFNPSARGGRSAQLSFSNSDSDENPFAFSITGAGLNSNPAAVANTIQRLSDTRVAKVEISTLLANDTDADADALTITQVSNPLPSGATVRISGGFVIYTAPAANSGHGSFQYTISDGIGGTATGAVTVSQTTPGISDTPPRSIGIAPDGADFLIKFIGVPGRVYRVQKKTDLGGAWTDFEPPELITAPNGGVFTFRHPSPGSGQHFYRVIPNF